jgi:hypothetical protein
VFGRATGIPAPVPHRRGDVAIPGSRHFRFSTTFERWFGTWRTEKYVLETGVLVLWFAVLAALIGGTTGSRDATKEDILMRENTSDSVVIENTSTELAWISWRVVNLDDSREHSTLPKDALWDSCSNGRIVGVPAGSRLFLGYDPPGAGRVSLALYVHRNRRCGPETSVKSIVLHERATSP